MTPSSTRSRRPDPGLGVGAHGEPKSSHAIPRHTVPTRLSDLQDPRPAVDAASESSSDEYSVPSPSQTLRRTGTASKSFTGNEEAALLRKLDRRLTLFLALLYLLSFLDRSNIGNARIAGLDKSLSLSSAQYDWLLTAFYITYITFEWMILLYKLLPAHIYISLCVLCWGLVASLQSLVTSFPQLLVLRALLGITEAAFGPGVPFYMTFFYRREELAYRVGLQISAAPLATSFASSLAWLIVWLTNKIGGIESWRALFLVEGFPSILVAVWAWYWIPDSPSTARWLTPRERRVATLRMQEERDRKTITNEILANPSQANTPDSKLSLNEIVTTLKTPHSLLPALMFFSVNVSFASLPVFLPTIINSMAFSALTSQALAAPPYLCAFAFVLLIGRASDRIPDSRGLFIIAVATLSSVSYAVIALAGALENVIGSSASVILRYLFIYPAAMGLFSAVTLIITWTLNNQQSSTSKGAGMVLLNVVGQCGPLVGVHLFPKSQGPHYVVGMGVSAGFMAGVGLLAVAMRWWLRRLNEEVGVKGAYEMVGKEGESEEREGMLGAEGDEMGGSGEGKRDGVWRYML